MNRGFIVFTTKSSIINISGGNNHLNQLINVKGVDYARVNYQLTILEFKSINRYYRYYNKRTMLEECSCDL